MPAPTTRRSPDAAPPARHRRSRRPAVSLGIVATLSGVVVPATSAAAAGGDYTVRPGDTLSHIAARSGTSAAAIASANGIADPSRIRAGQRLSLAAPPAAPPASPPAAPATYTVRPGDTLSHIAARTGTSVAALAGANGIADPGRIRAGRTLTLPTGASTGTAPAAAPAPSGTHTVAPGDTVGHVAARAGVPVAAVLRANGLSATSIIRPGQVLAVPAAGAPAPSASPAPATSAPMPTSFAGRTYASGVTSAAAINRDTLAAREVPGREEMRRIVADTARAMGVDPALALAVAYQESGFDQRAVSPANAVGVMQVIPTSGQWASSLVGRQLDLLDPHDNATAGVAILRSLERSASDRATAIAGYYQGLAGVRRHGMYPDTRRYVANVQTLVARFA